MLIVKVRDHYTLQVGKDTANWIPGPKRIKILDKAVLAGQMHKVEILQDDGSPDPVIVRGNEPAGSEVADTGGARAGFGAQASVEELLKQPESDEVARENERQRREITARQVMESSNNSAQERARKRVVEAAKLQQESRAKHSAAGLVEEVSDDYVLLADEQVTTEPTHVTVEELTTRAAPITNRIEDSVLAIEDEPTAEEIVIGADAEARAAEAAKPKPQRIVVEGVDPEKLKRALELVGTGALDNVGEAVKIYDAIQKGILVVKKPTEYRDELEAHAEKRSADLIEAADVLLEKNKELETDNGSLREAVALSEQRGEKAVAQREELMEKLAVAVKKATTAKKAAKKAKEEKMQEVEKNRMMGGATKTRDQKDAPKKVETRPAHEDIGVPPTPTPQKPKE